MGRLTWVTPQLHPEWQWKGGHRRCQSNARGRDGWWRFRGGSKHFKTRLLKPSDQKGTIEGRSRNLNSHAPSPGCSLHTNQWRTTQTLQENVLFHTPRLCIEEFSTVYIFIQMKVFLYFDNRKQWPIFRVIKSGTNETSPFSHHRPVAIKTTVGEHTTFYCWNPHTTEIQAYTILTELTLAFVWRDLIKHLVYSLLKTEILLYLKLADPWTTIRVTSYNGKNKTETHKNHFYERLMNFV